MDKKEFVAHLTARGFTHLFHANSVETGLSYFSVNSLGSRQFLENSKLLQSAQFTDSNDRKFGIWNDLFLNFHDHHRRFNRPNSFGPLCFRIPINALKGVLESSDTRVSVCKKNAENWSEQDKVEERWVKDVPELNTFFAEAIVPGQPRGFFKDGLFPDIVIAGVGSLSLNLVDQVIVEQHPNKPGHFETLNLLIKEIWPKLYRRPEIVTRRTDCKTYCACRKIESYNAKIEPLFSFDAKRCQSPSRPIK